jgi:glycosyltransferase involved in cell wall biosynthesis
MKAVEADLKAHFIFAAPRYLEMMNGADIMTMSTPGLVAHTKELTQRPVYMRRNFADSATLEDGRAAMAQGTPGDGLFRVCFASGSRGHEVDFALIADQITQFLSVGNNRRLMIVGHFDTDLLPEVLRGQVELHPFAGYDMYLQALARADVAVMPLVDDLFNRCKSGVRVIDAASVGVPSVVGTVSDMAQMVDDGKTGHVVTDAGWFDALDALARDTRVCAQMGQAARADLETRWAGARKDPGDHIIDPAVLDWVRG